MTKVLSFLCLLPLACAPEVDVQPDDVVFAVASEPALEQGGGKTMCATAEALAVEPELDNFLRAALTYWGGQGLDVSGWKVPDVPFDCDLDVWFPETSWSYWEEHPKAMAAAEVNGDLEPGKCVPTSLRLRLDSWGVALDNGWMQPILTHEVGHLLCLPHVLDDDTDIMAPSAGVEWK
jgi:hypothetical protein